jgi:hypothetical protein
LFLTFFGFWIPEILDLENPEAENENMQPRSNKLKCEARIVFISSL